MDRIDWIETAPQGAKAVFGLHHYVTAGTALPKSLIELVFLRVSQINGCARCIDQHSRELIQQGMSVDKLVLIPVWHETAYLFSDKERAALAWAEEVTNVSQTHASDAAYEAAHAAFGPKDLTDLTLTIATMNAINRLGIPFRMKPAARA